MVGVGRFQRNAAGHASAAKKIERRPAPFAKCIDGLDDAGASGTARRQCEIHQGLKRGTGKANDGLHDPLSPAFAQRTSAPVPPPPTLFDPHARLLRRRRALRLADPFLFDRAVDDLAERVDAIARPLPRLLLIGALSPGWAERFAAPGRTITSWEPAVHGDELTLPDGQFDAVVAAGTLAGVDRLPELLIGIRGLLLPDSPFLGALIGGDSLPALRKALIAADRLLGSSVAPRAHPRIDAPTMAALLDRSGFANPVVGIDRLNLRYATLDRLVGDLRAAAETNILDARPRTYPGMEWRRTVEAQLLSTGENGRFHERFELIHWIAWKPTELR
jgi:hypothetical protein